MDLFVRQLKRKTYTLLIFLVICLLVDLPFYTFSQTSTVANNDIEEIWSQIESQLKTHESDTSYSFISRLVSEHCNTNVDCQIMIYREIVYKFECSFNLPAAIYVSEKIVKLSHGAHNLEVEGEAYWNLSRFYGALGNEQLSVICNEKALKIYEKTGNQHSLIIAQMIKLEYSLSIGQVENVFQKMDSLLASAVVIGDTQVVQYLTVRMVDLKIMAGRYEEAANHISYLENLPVSDPIQHKEYGFLINAAYGRAKLALAENNLIKAEPFLQKTLELSEAAPDQWIEISVLQKLSELEWERGNTALAKAYLEKAQRKAEILKLDDLLTPIFSMKASIAEAEGRFEEALGFTRKMYSHHENFDRKKEGFDLQRYFLQLEKDQLWLDRENQNIELKLKKIELRNTIVIVILIFLLASGLAIGLYKQRKGKKELSSQNALIHQQAEKLESLDRAKSRFYANVSHELRTPLSLIVGPLSTFAKEIQLTDRKSKLLDIATQNTKILEDLINEILDLTKLDIGKMELNEKPTHVNALFQGYCAHFESLAMQKKVDFEVAVAINEDRFFNIDQEKFRQILYNLLFNAFKFTNEGDRVEAYISENIGHLQLRITDTGPGIHPEDLPHLFDRYYQTNRPEKPAEGGTGIGLALCYEYARLLGGKIEVDSTLGKGSTFRVEFPVSSVEAHHLEKFTEIEQKDQEYEEIRKNSHGSNQDDIDTVLIDNTYISSKPTVLVVEDNPKQQEYLNLILAEKYNIVAALNGKIAIDYLMSDNKCQLILSDLMMPVMDGCQLLEKVKSEDTLWHIPVIMLSGRADVGSKLNALRIGVDDYLIKPYNEDELLVRIDNLLTNQAARNIVDDTKTDSLRTTSTFSKSDLDWLKTFEDYIREHLSENTLSVPTLASEFAMSESSLLRQLKRLTGLTPAKYLQEMRLDKARHLLENRIYSSIAKVTYEVGYNDVRSFSRSFKQRFGKSPSNFIS